MIKNINNYVPIKEEAELIFNEQQISSLYNYKKISKLWKYPDDVIVEYCEYQDKGSAKSDYNYYHIVNNAGFEFNVEKININ